MRNHWPTAKLGDVLSRVERFEARDELTEYQFAGTYSFARGIFVANRKLGSTFSLPQIQRIRAGDFIYCKIMAWEGAFGLAPKEVDNCVMSGAFVVYEVDRERMDPKFLDYFFKVPGHWQTIGQQSTGTNVRRQSLHPDQFESASIPLPTLSEQQRLVARIDEILAQIEDARTLRKEANQLTELFVSSRSAEIFQDAFKHETVPFEKLGILERGKFSHRPRNEPRFFGGAHPWIQIGEIEAARKFIRNWTETLNDDGLAISKKFPKGTVLISIAATIGAVGILDFDCCVPDSIVGITPRNGSDSEFLYYFLRYLRDHLEDLAPQSAQKNINLRILSPLPSPKLTLDEQRRIVAELDTLQAKVDALKRLQAETTAELDALLPSILDKAFKGEL